MSFDRVFQERTRFQRAIFLTSATFLARQESKMSEGQQRKIIHIDCDSFFASVEMRDDPAFAAAP